QPEFNRRIRNAKTLWPIDIQLKLGIVPTETWARKIEHDTHLHVPREDEADRTRDSTHRYCVKKSSGRPLKIQMWQQRIICKRANLPTEFRTELIQKTWGE